jgi:hypothetical protein
MIAICTTKKDTLRVFSPFESSQKVSDAYEKGEDLTCPQDVDGVTWFEIRPLTSSERRAARAMAPELPDDESDMMRSAWILELQKSYLAFGLVNVEHEGWEATKCKRFLGRAHFELDALDAIPEETQIWLANAVFQLSHPK